jgi:hypothetical protein
MAGPLCFPAGLIMARLTFFGGRDTVFMYL